MAIRRNPLRVPRIGRNHIITRHAGIVAGRNNRVEKRQAGIVAGRGHQRMSAAAQKASEQNRCETGQRCEDGLLPVRLPWLPPADLPEERRLLYVGMTRAQQRLILTAAHRRTVENRLCPFLDHLPAELLVESRAAPRRRQARQLSLLK